MSTKTGIYLFALALCLSACQGGGEPVPQPTTKVLAFPGADGGGKYATGGRGGVVVHVTTLEDTRDPSTGQPTIGTLRKALQMDGSRTVVFDVSGTINLTSQLEMPFRSTTTVTSSWTTVRSPGARTSASAATATPISHCSTASSQRVSKSLCMLRVRTATAVYGAARMLRSTTTCSRIIRAETRVSTMTS